MSCVPEQSCSDGASAAGGGGGGGGGEGGVEGNGTMYKQQH